MRPTLKEIAAAADVSISTVSRALNGHPAIGEACVAKVRAVAEKLQYRPRRTSRRIDPTQVLCGRRVALVSLGLDRSLLALPVVAAALSGVEAALSEAEADFTIVHVPDLDQAPRALDRAKFDGVILHGAMQGTWIVKAGHDWIAELCDLPSLWMLGRPAGFAGSAVSANDFAVGAAAAEYLVQHGHRQLAIVNPKPDHLLFMRREDSFTSRAQRLGAKVQHFCEAPPGGWHLPLRPPLHVETVQRLVDRVLAAEPRPTAIFATADSVATLVYRALAVRDLRVGRDMSVISGNNDRNLIAALHPHLTTFDIHPEHIGRFAVRQLAMRLAEQGAQPDVETMVEPTLVEGASVIENSECLDNTETSTHESEAPVGKG